MYVVEDDFSLLQEHHTQARLFHSKESHGCGVLVDHLMGLRVQPRSRHEMAVEVLPGAALLPSGQEVIVDKPVVVTLDTSGMKIPGLLYLYLKAFDELSDFVQYDDNPQFKGHKRVVTKHKIETTPVQLDSPNALELARILITANLREILACSGSKPQPGEIDRRFVPLLPPVGIKSSIETHVAYWDLMEDFLQVLSSIAKSVASQAAREARIHVRQHLMYRYHHGFHSVGVNAFLTQLLLLFKEMGQELQVLDAGKAKNRDFKEFIRHNEECATQLHSQPPSMSHVALLVGILQKAVRSLASVYEGAPSEAPVLFDVKNFSDEDLMLWSQDFESKIFVGNAPYRLVQRVNLLDPDSEKQYGVSVEGAGPDDTWTSRQRFTYPDSTVVIDAGRAYTRGLLKLHLVGLAPGKDVLLIKRIDYSRGNWQTKVRLSDVELPSWEVIGRDLKHRWRNTLYRITGSQVSDSQMTFSEEFLKAELDVNIFQLWVFQSDL
jgi:hypothetical protein